MVSVPFLAASLALGEDWQAVGHALERRWLELDAVYGPWVLAALLALAVARALVRGRRYRAVDALSESERAALRARVTAAEETTDGELVVVVVEASDGHPDGAWRAGVAVFVLATLLLAGHLPWDRPFVVVALQLVFGAVGYGLARSLPDLRRSFIGERRATEVAEEQALQELQRLELTSHPERNAVLLFVSLFEQRVVVLADEAAHATVGAEAWATVDAAVLAGIREGSLCTGLERGIDAAGAVLAARIPRTADGPNRHRDDIDVRRR